MRIEVICECGEIYRFREEYAGQSTRCSRCGAPILVQPKVTGNPRGLDPVFCRDRFLLKQKHFAIGEKYAVSDEQGLPILFIHRPQHVLRGLLSVCCGLLAGAFFALVCITIGAALPDRIGGIFLVAGMIGAVLVTIAVGVQLGPRRHVLFHRDENRGEILMRVMQDQKWVFLNARYTVRDAADQPLAVLEKNYLYDLFRKRWICRTPDGVPLCIAREDSIVLSLLRRVLGPMFGMLRTNFVLLSPDERTEYGVFNRKLTLLDRYVLDLGADPEHRLDRRVALGLGVMLDSGERR